MDNFIKNLTESILSIESSIGYIYSDDGFSKPIINETSPYYDEWKEILINPDNTHLEMYDIVSPEGEKHYYYTYTAGRYDPKAGEMFYAAIATGNFFHSMTGCFSDLLHNFPFINV